jgi:hypothetical protein
MEREGMRKRSWAFIGAFPAGFMNIFGEYARGKQEKR